MAGHDSDRLLDVTEGRDGTLATVIQRELLDQEMVQRLGQQLKQIAQQNHQVQLRLNMGNVEHLSSAALAGFIAWDRWVKQDGGQLSLCNLRPHLLQIFQATNLDQSLHLLDASEVPEERAADCAATSATSLSGSPSLETVPSRGGMSTVVLCDPQPRRAARIIAALSKKLDVVWLDDWDKLDEHCRSQWTVAVLAPLEHDASSPGDAPPCLWNFLEHHGRRQQVIAFADDDDLTLETYCRTLEAGVRQIIDADAANFLERLTAGLLQLVDDRQREVAQQGRCISRLNQMGIIAVSRAMHEVFARVMRAAEFSDLPVLVMGETGTGKQCIAQAIHNLDQSRSRHQLVTLDCGSISEKLAESQLFGHTKGAFSGADQERLGLFRTANGGTLLLDEIGELPLQLQPKLLRVLQEHRLLPLGADYEHRVDVRVVAATNRPLRQMVQEGRFRNDLYQRLNVLSIEIPSLRDRPEDIAPQAEHFLQAYHQGNRHRLRGFSPRVLDTLRHLPWEGNTRQLEYLVREIVAHRPRGPQIEMEDLPRWVIERVAQDDQQAAMHDGTSSDAQHRGDAQVDSTADPLADLIVWAERQQLSLSELVEQIERRMLRHALSKHRGNRTRAAEALGLSRPGLRNKIRKYECDG